jgi:hypothetical protein
MSSRFPRKNDTVSKRMSIDIKSAHAALSLETPFNSYKS